MRGTNEQKTTAIPVKREVQRNVRMPKYSEQDLKYAAEFREGVHREALAIIRKTRPNVTEVIDRHPVEDYFQENWEYPGKWYPIVAIPYGYKSRAALVDAIVRDTLCGKAPEKERTHTQERRDAADRESPSDPLGAKPDGYQEPFAAKLENDPFYRLIAEYPDLAVDYFIVEDERYCGYESHRKALKAAFGRLGGAWEGDPDRASGKKISAGEPFSSDYPKGKLNYRKAFLYPPHRIGYTGKDFARVNAALFPNGTDGLEVYEWDTNWSDYFDEGHEWWGALCLTLYDQTLKRFVVITASATD